MKTKANMKNAVIYHFTDVSDKRPKIYTGQLKALNAFAISKGFHITAVYCDKTLRRYEQKEFYRLIDSADDFDALIVKDLYHLSKNTKQCFRILRNLQKKDVSVYTLEDGDYLCTDNSDAPLLKPLKVATYNCLQCRHKNITPILNLQNDVLSFFTNNKTAWQIIDRFNDISSRQVEGDQPQLQELIANNEKYDLLLVNDVNDIHGRTAKFSEIREALNLSIYSLQEGYIPKQAGL